MESVVYKEKSVKQSEMNWKKYRLLVFSSPIG